MEVIYRSFIRNQTSFCGEIILLVSQCSMFEVSFIWYRLVCFDKLMMIFKGIANKYLYLFKASVGEMKSGKVFLIFKLLSSVQSQMSLLKGKKKCCESHMLENLSCFCTVQYVFIMELS